MTAPFRSPADNPHVKRAIEALRRAQACINAFEDNVNEDKRDQALGAAASLLALVTTGHHVSSARGEHLSLEANHKALWTSISEARTLLAKAGFDVGPNPEPSWGRRHDVKAARRDLQRLQALLPGVDFTPQTDEEVEAYLRAQRRGRLWFWLAVPLLFVGLIVGMSLGMIYC